MAVLDRRSRSTTAMVDDSELIPYDWRIGLGI
jgi:hypothetical protein